MPKSTSFHRVQPTGCGPRAEPGPPAAWCAELIPFFASFTPRYEKYPGERRSQPFLRKDEKRQPGTLISVPGMFVARLSEKEHVEGWKNDRVQYPLNVQVRTPWPWPRAKSNPRRFDWDNELWSPAYTSMGGKPFTLPREPGLTGNKTTYHWRCKRICSPVKPTCIYHRVVMRQYLNRLSLSALRERRREPPGRAV